MECRALRSGKGKRTDSPQRFKRNTALLTNFGLLTMRTVR